jgi:hypothetical protein
VIALNFQTDEIVMTIISRDGGGVLIHDYLTQFVGIMLQNIAFGNTLVEKYMNYGLND